jgi:hypothetical protein
MTVYITQALRETFEKIGVEPDLFIGLFQDFKAGGVEGGYVFGWDTTYRTPYVNGMSHTLRHVHMVPLANDRETAEWNELARKGKHRTSNRALVYVTDVDGDHLLIEVLEEIPGAHEVCKMLTDDHRKLMKKYAVIAGEFLRKGTISY